MRQGSDLSNNLWWTSSICLLLSHFLLRRSKQLRTSLFASNPSSEYHPKLSPPFISINSALCCIVPCNVWFKRAHGKLFAMLSIVSLQCCSNFTTSIFLVHETMRRIMLNCLCSFVIASLCFLLCLWLRKSSIPVNNSSE